MITQIVYLVIAIVVLTLGLAFVCIRGDQMEDRIEHLEFLLKHQRNMFKLNVDHVKNIYNNFSKYSEEIEQLKKDLSVLEGIQSKMDIEHLNIDVLETKLNGLEWLINNLYPVSSKITVTDKPDPLNPSGIIYCGTNITGLKSEK